MMLRRRFLLALGLFVARFRAAPVSAARPECIFGAIRWDAQYCDTPGQPCAEEERSLGPEKWRYRAPLHTQPVGSEGVRFTPSQATFDAEISTAAEAGLRYWAYLMYGENGAIDLDHSMMRALKYHRESANRARMNYAMIVGTHTLGFTDRYAEPVARVVSLMRDDNYQRVLQGRPLLFFFHEKDQLKSYWGGDPAKLAKAIAALRREAKRADLGDPYIVVLLSPPADAEALRVAIGADGISTYAIALGPTSGVGPYPKFAAAVRGYWESEKAATSADVVPTVMIGWDTRPRKEHPPSWTDRSATRPDTAAHVEPPTPAEFAASCADARRFMEANATRCPARLALIYAWNENSEGGALEPTLGDPSGSLLRAAATAWR